MQLCKECFYVALEAEVHDTIVRHNLFRPRETVAIGASGGKDSTVLAHMMKLLNARHGCASCSVSRSSAAACSIATAQLKVAPIPIHRFQRIPEHVRMLCTSSRRNTNCRHASPGPQYVVHSADAACALCSYGLVLWLLSVDEGIAGYRDDSLETVKRNEQQYDIPLKIVSYKQLYGWTMDEIVQQIGTRNNCTFCGVFRRQALDRGAALLKADKVATGHNADDIAETVILNIIRGDIPRCALCLRLPPRSQVKAR